MEAKRFVLFAGRHDMPDNEGAVFQSFSFEKMEGVYEKNFTEYMKTTNEVTIYVTGLTPAVIQVCRDYKNKKIIFLHFNRDEGNYVEQIF